MIKKIITLIFVAGILSARPGDAWFEHISNETGLPDNRVTSILQDREGFLWFGTLAGVVRYDGYGFDKYDKDPENPNSLSQNTVWDMCQDHAGNIWIGTFKGLNRLDPVTGKIQIYLHDPNDSQSISSNIVICMLEDMDHYLWIGTANGLNLYNLVTNTFEPLPDFGDYNKLFHKLRIEAIYSDSRHNIWISTTEENGQFAGIFCYDPVQKIIKKIYLDVLSPELAAKNPVLVIHEDLFGRYWFGTGYGLIKYDPYTGKSRFIVYHEKNVPGPDDSGFNAIIYDHKNGLWAGSGSTGLYHIDLSTEQIRNYRHERQNQKGLSDDTIYDLYLDQTDNLWIATFGGGINKQHFRASPFQNYQPAGNDDLYIVSIVQTADKKIWLGTRNNGLVEYDLPANTLIYHPLKLNSNMTISNYVRNIYESKSGQFWLGLVGGIGIFDIHNRRMVHFLDFKETGNTTQAVYVQRILSDERGYFWAATNRGLCKINPVSFEVTNIYFPYESNPQFEGQNGITELYIDSQRKLWAGTYNGLYRFDRSLEKFELIDLESKSGYPASSNLVLAIYEDESGYLWVGTESGLYRLNTSSGEIARFSTEHGLQNDFIHAIISDHNNNIWLSTNWGLSQYLQERQQFRNFDMSDGLAGNQFYNRSVFKNSDNEIFFGGENGLTVFKPDNITQSNFRPNVLITQLRTNKGEFRADSTITYKKRVILDHDDNFFTIYFTSLDYSAPNKNCFRYKLDGIDNEWIQANQRMVNYTDIPSGEYMFHLKGSNTDGIFADKEVQLQIIILSPWWATTFMYGLYFAALTGLAGFLFWLIILRIKNRHKRKLEQLQLEKLKEINQLKSTFFANISHEFRTPLTLIDGTIKQLREGNIKSNFMSQCNLILRNTRQLQDLVDQLLDLAKLESGTVKLTTSKVDVIPLVKGLCDAFISLTELHNIDFKFVASDKILKLFLDIEKVEKIVNNLIANAIKYTPDGGKIILRIQQLGIDYSRDELEMLPIHLTAGQDPGYDGKLNLSVVKTPALVLQVINTGPGIPREKLEKIFERFYRLQDSQVGKQHGAGIGLALVSDLVNIHKGKISASSEPHVETIFEVILPSVPEAAETDQTDRNFDLVEIIETDEKVQSEEENFDQILSQTQSKDKKESVLIIEDHRDLSSYIANILGGKYEILKAAEGAQGLNLAREHMPDLVISDVMMPGMDGFQFCHELKTDPMISHIPVILLTALVENEDRIHGLESGADDYITKPFDSSELSVRVSNLIEQRKIMRMKFAKDPAIESSELTVPNSDKQFLTRLRVIVEQNISDPNFSVPDLAATLGLSRASLYRKLMALTGMTPVDLVRVIRLRYAYDMLKKHSGNVTDVAYGVGFTSISYFSRCFQRQYGMKPSEFLRHNVIVQ